MPFAQFVSTEFIAGFNLVVCYYALGDVDLMKRGFTRLLSVPLPVSDDEEAKDDDEDDDADLSKLEMSRVSFAPRMRASARTVPCCRVAPHPHPGIHRKLS
jgi:hypothetical protein